MTITIPQKIEIIKAAYKYSGSDIGAIEQECGAIETWDLRGFNSALDAMMDDEVLWGLLCKDFPFLLDVPEAGF